MPETEKHRPVGAYLPVGQLDGDCACGRGAYPCPDTPPAQHPAAKCDYCDQRATTLAGDTNGVLVCEGHVRLFAERGIAATIDAPQHPVAPETETDANGLTEAERSWGIARENGATVYAEHDVERIVAERVRVVEGERDAVVEVGAYAQQKEATARAVNDAARMAQVAARRTRELAAMTARAESAEAAHEAEKAAHERLRAGVEALADEWANTPWDQTPHLGCLDMYRHCAGILTTLLGGGGAR